MKYDSIIIGAGLSGLAAGIRMALFDKKVVIVEKHTVPGGLNSFYARKHRTFDVGLHAMTNYSPPGDRRSPLGKLLKQLRFRHEEFRLRQQEMSEIRFPGKSLRFSNDFEFFKQEIAEQFPEQMDGFQKLLQIIQSYDEVSLNSDDGPSAKEVMGRFLSDPLLIDMLFCPLAYYGSAREHDMDFYQFVIMFKSIFMEGFSKPEGGMHYILQLMVDKYQRLGGEMIMGDGVKSIPVRNGVAGTVELESGRELQADAILSSAGYIETLKLCAPELDIAQQTTPGQMTFMESIFVLDRNPKSLGYDRSIVFYNLTERFRYQTPDQAIDVDSGVLCCPNHFQYETPLSEGILRLTNQANYDYWNGLIRKDYIAAKKECRAKALERLAKFFPEFSETVVFLDTFTPKTIHKYTGHLNGAVYGAPEKLKNGETPIQNLFICGTDQGFLGIIGATLSGISMANLHLLKP
ncbi:MAG: NAD(P)/FAD-dependent oxidoreductase [Candidatus Nitrohelix vancouverensis]|uniref:NAD(P)/FAD-dependent oxidoreductase n=1 Tax=Candidatus Nitrohelix vancouverensis TaxID=2705534 RepID=A0A7T0G2W8_9BACT|nr:MAG: NAD(P)/FAD-dependent oxidoreductase [Candidatus Nitrohelix vancouverensis]